MNCVILQPSYVPWRGYFDLVHRADVFVFYDDVQYDKHGWRNRNRVKTPQGTQWLTIPVRAAGNVESGLRILDVKTNPAARWAKKHAQTLKQAYARAPRFAEVAPLVDEIYAESPERLCDFTIASTVRLARALGITHTRFVRSSELGVAGERTERLVDIVRGVGATRYISGPSAQAYLEPARFDAAGLALEYIEYDYPEYPQLHPPYDAAVSIWDTLFMLGDEASDYIWGARAAAHRARPR